MPASPPRAARHTGAGTSRRVVARGALWAVPVISVSATAPAMAASTQLCTALPASQKGVLTYGSDTGTAWTTATGSAGSVTATHNSPTWYSSGGTPSGSTYNPPTDADWVRRLSNVTSTSSTKNIGDQTQYNNDVFFSLGNRTGMPAGYQEVTITFSAAVYGLSFYITDIDRNTGFADTVSVRATTDGTTAAAAPSRFFPTGAGLNAAAGWPVPAVASTVTGSGTTASPWTNTQASTNYDIGSAGGDVYVSYASTTPVKTLTFRYGSTVSVTTDQQIYISPMAYTTVPCATAA